MLRNLDPTKDSLADNEEIQVSLRRTIETALILLIIKELYRQSMSLRPKIVKLIDKYNQKKGAPVGRPPHSYP